MTDPLSATPLPASLMELAGRGEVRRVLFWHLTDRWYFGDFLRHAPWLPWLRDSFPSADVDAATHPDYLPLLDGGGYAGLLDARTLDPGSLGGYDLVVVPGPFEPALPRINCGTVLFTWDTGWVLQVDGMPRARGNKRGINYFAAADPRAISTVAAAAEGPGFRVVLREAETAAVAAAVDRVWPDGRPVVVYNPTSSNPFTRETTAPKEVDNSLTAAEHAVVLRRLMRLLPDHAFIVGAARKPNDDANTAVVVEVAARCAGPRVVSLDDLGLPGVQSLRGFAAVLGSDRVCCVAGGGTGTNTHLAACTGTFGFSMEHGTDAAMVRNWHRPGDFQMGSFRWRNPDELTGTTSLDWSDRTPEALAAVADAFGCHHALAHGDWERLFTDPPAARRAVRGFASAWPQQLWSAIGYAWQLLDVMTADARAHYGDFTDEAAYLRIVHGSGDSGGGPDLTGSGEGLAVLASALDDRPAAVLAADLFEHSNLHKLLHHLDTVQADAQSDTHPDAQPGVRLDADRPSLVESGGGR